MLLDRARRLNEIVLPGRLLFGPTNVVLGVNNFCNLRCLMCDVGTGNTETNFGANLTGAKTASMPWETYKEIADQVHALWPRAPLSFVYTEPLAWPLIGKALHYAALKELPTQVTTNGLLLSRWAEEIAAARCGAVAVSLDGPEEVHDAIRRKTGSFARAVAGIEALAAQPHAPEIGVYCAISELNVGTLRQFLRDIAHLPLKEVGFLHTNFVTEAQAARHNEAFGADFHATPSNVFDVSPVRVDLAVLAEELTEIRATPYPFAVRMSPNLVTLDELVVYYRNPDIAVGRQCIDAFRSIMIDPDGDIIPVHGRCFRFPVVNIHREGLEGAWNHERLSQLRRTLAKSGGLMPACTRCCSGFAGRALQ
jgi:MoaA/NifB/PqqE/SkfB family radical SAM enzyme